MARKINTKVKKAYLTSLQVERKGTKKIEGEVQQ
jgi:hypothetical protein